MRKFLTYICTALIFSTSALAYWGNYSAYDVYQYAASGDFRSLQDAAGSVNATDSNGQTAICYAISNRDYVAYKNLVMLHADEQPACVKNMNKQDYEDFKRGYELRGGKISTSSFSLGGSTTAWTIAGIAAVGAGVAVAAGGGGGGGGGGGSSSGGSSEQTPTPTPTPSVACEGYPLYSCPLNSLCDSCIGADHIMYKRVGCQPGYKENPSNTGCITDTSVVEDYPLTECDINGECISAMSGNTRMYKLVSCHEGYKLSADESHCDKICEGYTKTACNTNTEYLSDTCSEDESYHICTQRSNTNHCSEFVTDQDLCTACSGTNYKLNDEGKCIQMCKGYTTTPCDNQTQYTQLCEDNNDYHKCISRTHTNGCAGYYMYSDTCTGCKGGFELTSESTCDVICPGYTQDSCNESQYMLSKCPTNETYHICADRSMPEGCMQLNPGKDECISCYPGYKLNDETKACVKICTEYSQQPCNKATQYISEVCSDDENFHKCATRTVLFSCTDWNINADKCLGCDNGYELDSKGACKPACPDEYTDKECAKLEYIPSDGYCANNKDYHTCAARKNTYKCEVFNKYEDWCDECEDGYEVISHVCRLKCPEYTREECNYAKEWQSEVCPRHDAYHKCSVRYNLVGCAEFSKTSDTCTKCDGTDPNPVNGVCECKGHKTEECILELEYESAVCPTAKGYHVCTERENTEGCLKFNPKYDECTLCDKDNYYLREKRRATTTDDDGEEVTTISGICTKRENTRGCLKYDELHDACTECEKEEYYLNRAVDAEGKPLSYGICTKREHGKGCKVFNEFEDKCLECDLKDVYYLPFDDKGKTTVCIERTRTDGCTQYEEHYDTCTECTNDSHYLDLAKGENDKTDDGYCTLRKHGEGCSQREVNYDSCTECSDNNTYYLDLNEKKNPDKEVKDGYCTIRTRTTGCTQFYETLDRCTECIKAQYFLSRDNIVKTGADGNVLTGSDNKPLTEPANYGICTLRDHGSNCSQYEIFYDTCTQCEDNKTYYLDLDKGENPDTDDGYCKIRNHADGCSQFEVNFDTCTQCENVGTHYLDLSEGKNDDTEDGYCKVRKHADGCSQFEVNFDTCTQCENVGTHYLDLNEGENDDTDDGYCVVRKHADGCSQFEVNYDTCTQCTSIKSSYLKIATEEGKHNPSNPNDGYCTTRNHGENCSQFEVHYDTCTKCTSIKDYYLKHVDTEGEHNPSSNTDGYCEARTHDNGCEQFYEYLDKCTKCVNATHYYNEDTVTVEAEVKGLGYGDCIERKNDKGCKLPTETADTCDECDDKVTYYLPLDKNNKTTVCTERTHGDNCSQREVHYDTCTECEDKDNYYLDLNGGQGTSPTNDGYCTKRINTAGCEKYVEKLDFCTQCTKSQYYLARETIPGETEGTTELATYGKCTLRDWADGCDQFEVNYDTCTHCTDNKTHYLDTSFAQNENKKDGHCVVRQHAAGCDQFEGNYDTCTHCTDNSTHYLDLSKHETAGGKDGHCTVRLHASGCDQYEVNYDTCTHCTDNKTHYLDLEKGENQATNVKDGYCMPRTNTLGCEEFETNLDQCTRCEDITETYLSGGKCNTRTVTEGCAGFVTNADKCMSCIAGYTLDENITDFAEAKVGKCINNSVVCFGFQQETCDYDTTYMPLENVVDGSGSITNRIYCQYDNSYHKCLARTNYEGCDRYSLHANTCEHCIDGYTLNEANGNCDSNAKLCAGYVQYKCNLETQYMPLYDICSADPSYHKCLTRTKSTSGCVNPNGIDPNKDRCTDCKDGYYPIKEGDDIGECKENCPLSEGYTDVDCGEGYYEERCSMNSAFHKCHPRTRDYTHCTPGQYNPIDDNCLGCDIRYMPNTDKNANEVCKNQCVDDKDHNYIEAVECPDRFYKNATCSAFPEFISCMPRTEMDGCETPDPVNNRCLSCKEGYKLINYQCFLISDLCGGFTQDECDIDTQYMPLGAENLCVHDTTYHKCELRKKSTLGCVKLAPNNDACIDCDDTNYINPPTNGECKEKCPAKDGWTMTSCTDSFYESEVCKHDTKYHKCKKREKNYTNCEVKKNDADECETCRDKYKAQINGNNVCTEICVGSAGKPYVLRSDCDTDKRYLGLQCEEDERYVQCIPRTVTEHCTSFNEEKDWCTNCDDGYEVNSSHRCVQICPGYFKDGCEQYGLTHVKSGEQLLTCYDESSSPKTEYKNYFKCKGNIYIEGCEQYSQDKEHCDYCSHWYELGSDRKSCKKCNIVMNCAQQAKNTCLCQACVSGYDTEDGSVCTYNEDLVPSGGGGGDSGSDWCDEDGVCNSEIKGWVDHCVQWGNSGGQCEEWDERLDLKKYPALKQIDCPTSSGNIVGYQCGCEPGYVIYDIYYAKKGYVRRKAGGTQPLAHQGWGCCKADKLTDREVKDPVFGLYVGKCEQGSDGDGGTFKDCSIYTDTPIKESCTTGELIKTYYNGEKCKYSGNDKVYRTCLTRKRTEGCTGFDEEWDACTACEDGYTLNSETHHAEFCEKNDSGECVDSDTDCPEGQCHLQDSTGCPDGQTKCGTPSRNDEDSLDICTDPEALCGTSACDNKTEWKSKKKCDGQTWICIKRKNKDHCTSFDEWSDMCLTCENSYGAGDNTGNNTAVNGKCEIQTTCTEATCPSGSHAYKDDCTTSSTAHKCMEDITGCKDNSYDTGNGLCTECKTGYWKSDKDGVIPAVGEEPSGSVKYCVHDGCDTGACDPTSQYPDPNAKCKGSNRSHCLTAATVNHCSEFGQDTSNLATLGKCISCEAGWGDAKGNSVQNASGDFECPKLITDEHCKSSCNISVEYRDADRSEEYCGGDKPIYCAVRFYSMNNCGTYQEAKDRCNSCKNSSYTLKSGICIPSYGVRCITTTECLSGTNSKTNGYKEAYTIPKAAYQELYGYYCSSGNTSTDGACIPRTHTSANCVEYHQVFDKCLYCRMSGAKCYGIIKGNNCMADEHGLCEGDDGFDADYNSIVNSYPDLNTQSTRVVKVHEVEEGMTKGMTKYVAKSNTLENFNDEITAYNGLTDGITQKIVAVGEFNNAVDITGAVNVHNGSEEGDGIGVIEIVRDETGTPIKGAVKGLVGGNNYEGSSVDINLDVKDSAQGEKRSFIAGMGKEVGAYKSGDKDELSGIDLGSAAYGQHNQELINAGNVSISSDGDAPVFGMLGLRHADNVEKHSENQNLGDFTNAETGVINVNAPNAKEAYGIKVNNLINKEGLGTAYSNITNDGTINVSGGSNVYGISAKNANIYNNGDINISATGDNVYGIHADKSKVENTGNITISAPNAKEAYGICAVNGSVVKNEGVITINNSESTANKADGKFIHTDTSSYVLNEGTIISDKSLDTSSIGGRNLLMSNGGNITAPEVSGTLNLSSNVTTGSNANVYVMQNLVNGNTENLGVVSQSAMFSAALNDYGSTSDAVLTRNSFDTLLSNSSLADYLEKNYEAGKGTELFDELKKQTSLADLRDGIGDFFGSRLPKMTFEDMSIMREVNFDINRNMFTQEEEFEYGGNVTPYGYNESSSSTGRYALYGYNYGKKSYGLGVAISEVNSYDDEKADNRKDTSVVVSTPIARKMRGFEFITTPQIGYAYGEYNRVGFNNSYDGKVYKRMYALMNEVRYPMKMKKMRFTPSVEFNVIGFNVKGSEEDHKPFNLRIPSQTHYSVEAGAGFMLEKAFSLYNLHNFRFSSGLAFYHEFANPYELDIRMSELDGTYRLHDEKRHNNRVAARFGFDYELGSDIDVSMSVLSNIDGECRTDAVCDIKYHFW